MLTNLGLAICSFAMQMQNWAPRMTRNTCAS
jgi:hypothetical protein